MMTKAFAHNGASKVYIIGRRKEKLSAAVLEAGSQGNVIPIIGDVTNPQNLQSISSQISSETGFINLLICNSGVYSPSIANPAQVPISEFVQKAFSQGPEVWNDSFATNSTSVAFTAFAFLPLLHAGNLRGNCAGRQSQILVTSSIAGYLRNPQAVGAYPVTKAATTHLVKGLAGALVPYSIRVNALAPGLFPSDLAAELIAKGGTPLKEDPCVEGAFAKSFIPAQRVGVYLFFLFFFTLPLIPSPIHILLFSRDRVQYSTHLTHISSILSLMPSFLLSRFPSGHGRYSPLSRLGSRRVREWKYPSHRWRSNCHYARDVLM